MARSVSEIQAQMQAQVAANPTLSAALTSDSLYAIYTLFQFVIAFGIAYLEQLIDVFVAQSESQVSIAAAASAPWLQAQSFKFQYSDTNPQIAQLNATTFAWFYPQVDTSLCIISQCAVSTDLVGNCTLKVATGNPAQALTMDQLTQYQTFINTIGATIKYDCQSTPPDQMYVQAEVFYNGQYSAVIQSNVTQAINNFFANLSEGANFGTISGYVKMSALQNAIESVVGVTDCILQNVSARADGTSYGSGTNLVLAQTLLSRYWPTAAGYVIAETTTGHTLADSLTFIPAL
jgi:hypothetical protein